MSKQFVLFFLEKSSKLKTGRTANKVKQQEAASRMLAEVRFVFGQEKKGYGGGGGFGRGWGVTSVVGLLVISTSCCGWRRGWSVVFAVGAYSSRKEKNIQVIIAMETITKMAKAVLQSMKNLFIRSLLSYR